MSPKAVVFGTVVLDLVGFGIVIPLLPFYAEEHGATPVQVTLLMAVYSLAQFLCAPLWGQWSDRVGRRPVMLASIACTALALAAFAASTTLWMLFLCRALHGAMTANVSTAQACMADLTSREDRAAGMGLVGAAFGLGFTVGPFVGGYFAQWGTATPIWIAAACSALTWRWRGASCRRRGTRPRRRSGGGCRRLGSCRSSADPGSAASSAWPRCRSSPSRCWRAPSRFSRSTSTG